MLLGSIPFIVLAVMLAWRGYGRNALPWIIAGLVVYLVAFVITSAVNVPLNNQLHNAGNPAHSDLTAIRNSFEHKWVTWNIVRALVHAAAFGCLAWALVLYGAHRGQAHPAGKPSRGAPAATRAPAPVPPAGTPPTHLQPRAAQTPHG